MNFQTGSKQAKLSQFSESTDTVLMASSNSHIGQSLSPLFGKPTGQVARIGCHPDFIGLIEDDEEVYCPITTMFMDIEGSTSLALKYDLDTVYNIKNAFIQTAVQIICDLGGHVHRLMGDSVMAYFGGKSVKDEDSIIDGINCSAVLQHFAKNVVLNRLKDSGVNHEFGVRIGLDYGSMKDVLWRRYGIGGATEVTATSLYVDMAAKLQQTAGRHQVMLGQSLVSTIDFPGHLLSQKTVQIDGKTLPEPYVLPNYAKPDGTLLNYKKMHLDSTEYLRCTTFGQAKSVVSQNAGGLKNARISCTVHSDRDTFSEGIPYLPSSRVLPKNKWLKYAVSLPYMPQLPYQIVFEVENHGVEAKDACPDTLGSHKTTKGIKTKEQHDNIVHWESTAYRGLHYLNVRVPGHFQSRFGVYVE